MSAPNLSGKRVLILGAETDLGRAIATALTDAGATVALVAAAPDAEAAFAVQRLARRLAAPEHKIVSQAIDATNRTAVRVMMRQIAKATGGLHAAVLAADAGRLGARGCNLAFRFASEEFMRGGGGAFVAVAGNPLELDEMPDDAPFLTVRRSEDIVEAVTQVVNALADALNNR
jgi:NAD(P)-dependent dehydrogenase (short-subunit alcohol dehydrogenase family)